MSEDDNGILAKIGGEWISKALHNLPPAEASKEDTMVTMDVPGMGMVRFSAKRLRHKHGKDVHYFWSAIRADLS